MKLQIKVDKETFDGGSDEVELIITDEGYDNDYWGIIIDDIQ